MKVAFVVFDLSLYGGAERVTANIANRLSDSMDVSMISICGKNIVPPFELDSRITIYEIGVEKARIRQMMKSGRNMLRAFFKEHSFDVVLAEGHFAGLLLLPCCIFKRNNFVFCDHGSIMSQWKSKGKTLGRFIMALCYHRTVVVTERSREAYLKKFHLSKKKIICIYNWLDDRYVENSGEYDSKTKKIISVGRFGKEKGYDMLVKAAKKVMPNHSEWEWHIYGDGETFESTKKAILESNLEKQVILKGAVGNISELYKEYAFLVLPSYREGLPLVLLEAQANNLPLVSFDIITGPNEIISDGINGYLIPRYDIEKMAVHMGKLMDDEKLRADFSKHSQDNLDRFSPETIQKQWTGLFYEMKRR